MSYVRLRVWGTKLVFFFCILYVILPFPTYGINLEEATLFELAMFIIAIGASFYMYSIRCEGCKMIWYKAGFPKYKMPESLMDIDKNFLSIKKREMLSVINIKMTKNCKNCGMERY